VACIESSGLTDFREECLSFLAFLDFDGVLLAAMDQPESVSVFFLASKRFCATFQIHKASRAWLVEPLSTPCSGRTVVVPITRRIG